jgi:hypothetical protein
MRTVNVLLFSLATLVGAPQLTHADARPAASHELEGTKSVHKTIVMQTQVFASRHADALKNADAAKTNAERYERLRAEASGKPEHAAVFHELALKARSSEKAQRDYAVIVKDAQTSHEAETLRLQAKIDQLSK